MEATAQNTIVFEPNAPLEPTHFMEMIFPEHANHYGTLFGGNALALMSKAVFIAATRRARRRIVMARVEKVDFLSPVAVGEIVELCAHIVRQGHSSVTVVVKMMVENKDATQRLAASGSSEMVAVDEGGRPTAIGPSPSEDN
jgi:acyl-CoA hydrolase